MKKMLKCMPHAHAYVIEEPNGSHTLVSYDTKAATLTVDGWFTVHCWCSPTTRRHVAAFLDEYAYGLESRAAQSRADTGAYQTAKALYEGNMRLDVNTGEVVDCSEDHIIMIYTYDKEACYYTTDHNVAMDYLIRHLSGVFVVAEMDNLVQVSADEKASMVLDDLNGCDMISSWKGKTIKEVNRE